MNRPTGRPQGGGRAPAVNRSCACLHTMRDIGNRIHADSIVTPAEVDLAHNSNKLLLEAVLRLGPLDEGGPA